MDALKLSDEKKAEIPDTPEARVLELMELPMNQKESFLPPAGMTIQLGPYVYKVNYLNIGKLRFTCELVDVIIEGVNDGSEKVSTIINPHTGKGIVKE